VFVALRPARHKSVVDTNVEYGAALVARNDAKRGGATGGNAPEWRGVYKRVDTNRVDHPIPRVRLLEYDEGRRMRRCWNQIYVRTLQRSILTLRPVVRAQGATDPEIVSRRVTPTR
jgi:hypothetical protein